MTRPRGFVSWKPQSKSLALTPEQIAELALPSAPPKKTDRRAFDADYTVQCEAIPPDILTAILMEAIKVRQCPDIRADVLAQEQQDETELMNWARQ